MCVYTIQSAPSMSGWCSPGWVSPLTVNVTKLSSFFFVHQGRQQRHDRAVTQPDVGGESVSDADAAPGCPLTTPETRTSLRSFWTRGTCPTGCRPALRARGREPARRAGATSAHAVHAAPRCSSSSSLSSASRSFEVRIAQRSSACTYFQWLPT